MYWIDLKKWNGQFKNPKVQTLIRLRIDRMITHYKQCVMVNVEDCDIEGHQLSGIICTFPEDMVKCQGPMSLTSYQSYLGMLAVEKAFKMDEERYGKKIQDSHSHEILPVSN